MLRAEKEIGLGSDLRNIQTQRGHSPGIFMPEVKASELCCHKNKNGREREREYVS